MTTELKYEDLYALGCALDRPLEDLAMPAPEGAEEAAEALLREIRDTGPAHPQHAELMRVVGGTVRLRQMWEELLNEDTPATRQGIEDCNAAMAAHHR
jgi:hypothetical protein